MKYLKVTVLFSLFNRCGVSKQFRITDIIKVKLNALGAVLMLIFRVLNCDLVEL